MIQLLVHHWATTPLLGSAGSNCRVAKGSVSRSRELLFGTRVFYFLTNRQVPWTLCRRGLYKMHWIMLPRGGQR